MIYVSFAVSCSTHRGGKWAEAELKMDDYKSQGNAFNETMGRRDGMGVCLPFPLSKSGSASGLLSLHGSSMVVFSVCCGQRLF